MQIKELNLLTDDLAATCNFYRELLGLPVIDQTNKTVSFQAGQTKLIFSASINQQPAYHFAFNIPCNQVREAYDSIAHKTHVLDIEQGNKIADFTNWHAEAFYFIDNNGSVLEFIGRFDLKNQSSVPFSGTSILSISEVGIVTDNVTSTCNELIEQYGINYFDKQPPLKNFAAIGDDDGLFIVVPEHRNWYPTEMPSRKSKLKVVFSTDTQNEFIINN